MKRLAAWLLILAMLPLAGLAEKLEAEIAFCSAGNGSTVAAGTSVHFSIRADGAVQTQLMIVLPDSSRKGADGPETDVILDQEGTWAFVAYAKGADGQLVHSGQWRILAEDQKGEEQKKKEEEFRQWASRLRNAYDAMMTPEYYKVADLKVDFDNEKWAEDKKSGSTNSRKNPNYDAETKQFFLLAAEKVLKSNAEKIMPSAKGYYPGQVFNSLTGMWEADTTGNVMQISSDRKVDAQLEERNTKLKADAVKLGADIGMLFASVSDGRAYKYKNRLIDAVRNISLEGDQTDVENERAILANQYRDWMIGSLADNMEKVNDYIFLTIDRQKRNLESKKNLTRDEKLQLEVLRQVISYRETSEEIRASLNTGAVTYNGRQMTMSEALLLLAQDTIAGLGYEEQIVKSEKEISRLKAAIRMKEVLKGLLKALSDTVGAGDRAREIFRSSGFAARVGASSIASLSIEALIDLAVDNMVDMAVGLSPEDQSPDAFEGMKSFVIEAMDNWNGDTGDSIAFFEKFLAMEKSINQKYDAWIRDYRQYSDPAKAPEYIAIREQQRAAELSDQAKLYNAQKAYYQNVEDKAMRDSGRYSSGRLEAVKQNSGFVGAFICDSIGAAADALTSVIDVDFWSALGDTYDEDPGYSSIANQAYRIRQLAEAAEDTLHNSPDFYSAASIDEIVEETNTLRSILQYHAEGNLLYFSLAAAYAAERDPAHEKDVWNMYMDYAENELKRTYGIAVTYLWAIEIAGKLDAASRSEFFKYADEKMNGFKSVEASRSIVDQSVKNLDMFAVPDGYAAFFQQESGTN